MSRAQSAAHRHRVARTGIEGYTAAVANPQGAARKAAPRTSADVHEAPGDERGYWAMRLRVVRGRAQMAQGDGWTIAPIRILARHYPADSATWRWLREHGVERPRVGGDVPEDAREAKQVLLRLTDSQRTALDALAKRWGCTRSEAVVRAVKAAG